MRTIFLTGVLAAIGMGAGHLSAQAAAEKVEIGVLIFENFEKGQMRFIREGGGVQYVLWDDPKRKVKGTLQRIEADRMVVNDIPVLYAECKYIKGKVRSERDIGGGVLTGVGITTTALGTVFVGSLVGQGVLAGGITSLVAGLSMITGKRKFDFSKGWRAYGGKMEYRR